VSAFTRSGPTHDEDVVMTARLSNGVLASSTATRRSCGMHEVEILGDGGRVRVELLRFDGLTLQLAGSWPGGLKGRLQRVGYTISQLARTCVGRSRYRDSRQAYVGQWRHFAHCVRNGLPAEPSLEDGRRAQAGVRAALESASTGRAVRV